MGFLLLFATELLPLSRLGGRHFLVGESGSSCCLQESRAVSSPGLEVQLVLSPQQGTYTIMWGTFTRSQVCRLPDLLCTSPKQTGCLISPQALGVR
jgi:hypothetical protein